MDPVALRRITRAVINRVHPAIETKIIRFAAEKVDVLLSHEEVRVVNRIWPIDCLVISDRDRRCRWSCQTGAGRIAETNSESLVPFGVRIINDSYRETLRGSIPCSPGQGTHCINVITAWRSRAVKGVARRQAGIIDGGVGNRRCSARVACACDGDVYPRVAFSDRIRSSAKLKF